MAQPVCMWHHHVWAFPAFSHSNPTGNRWNVLFLNKISLIIVSCLFWLNFYACILCLNGKFKCQGNELCKVIQGLCDHFSPKINKCSTHSVCHVCMRTHVYVCVCVCVCSREGRGQGVCSYSFSNSINSHVSDRL